MAQLIYDSQTACYARERRRAIHKMGDKFDCECNPEIMTAFMYALNDADERVRAKAADEIGDQLRKSCCCCTPELVSALTCALGDCDRKVRRQAEQALKLCGYDIVDGCCCDSCCNSGCDSCHNGCTNGHAVPMPSNGSEPTPVPPEDPKAYFPSRLHQQAQTVPVSHSVGHSLGHSLSMGLANVFDLLD